MKCSHCLRLIPDYVDGQLPDSMEGELQVHLAKCQSCASEYERQRELFRAINRSMSSLASRAPISEGFEASVRNRLQREVLPAPERTLSIFRLRFRPAMAFASMLALLSLSIALLINFMLPAKNSQGAEVRSGHRYAFTTQPSEDGRIQANYYTKRYARIESAEDGWQR